MNDLELRNGPVAGSPSCFEILSLTNVPFSQQWTIELFSTTFVPAESFVNSRDFRRLGVLVREVRLL